MTIENHLHDWEEVGWKHQSLSQAAVKDLGLPVSHYHRFWIKGQACANPDCDALILHCDDAQAMRLAQEKFRSVTLAPEDPGSAPTEGVIVDFSLLTKPQDKAHW